MSLVSLHCSQDSSPRKVLSSDRPRRDQRPSSNSDENSAVAASPMCADNKCLVSRHAHCEYSYHIGDKVISLLLRLHRRPRLNQHDYPMHSGVHITHFTKWFLEISSVFRRKCCLDSSSHSVLTECFSATKSLGCKTTILKLV